MSDENREESHSLTIFQQQQLELQREDLALRREQLEFQKHQSELAYKQANQGLSANERYLQESLKYGEIQSRRNGWLGIASLLIVTILTAFLGYIGQLGIVTSIITVGAMIGAFAVGIRVQPRPKNPINGSASGDSSTNN